MSIPDFADDDQPTAESAGEANPLPLVPAAVPGHDLSAADASRPTADHVAMVSRVPPAKHLPPHCPHCRASLTAFLEAIQAQAPAMFPRQVVCNIRHPGDDALAYMEAGLLQSAMYAQPLIDAFQSLSSRMAYQPASEDIASAVLRLRDQARTTALAILRILQPSAYVATPVITRVVNRLAPPPPLDPFQETMAITRGVTTLISTLQDILLACPCHQPLL